MYVDGTVQMKNVYVYVWTLNVSIYESKCIVVSYQVVEKDAFSGV